MTLAVSFLKILVKVKNVISLMRKNHEFLKICIFISKFFFSRKSDWVFLSFYILMDLDFSVEFVVAVNLKKIVDKCYFDFIVTDVNGLTLTET